MTKGQNTLEEIYTAMRDKNIYYIKYDFMDKDRPACVEIERRRLPGSFTLTLVKRDNKKMRWKIMKTMECWCDHWYARFMERGAKPSQDKRNKNSMTVFVMESGCRTYYWDRVEEGLPKIDKGIEKVNQYLQAEEQYDKDKYVRIYMAESLTPGLAPIKMVI